jgi:hypothetical protein
VRSTPDSSHIELEQQHIAVLHDVFLAFHAIESFLARGGDGTALTRSSYATVSALMKPRSKSCG